MMFSQGLRVRVTILGQCYEHIIKSSFKCIFLQPQSKELQLIVCFRCNKSMHCNFARLLCETHSWVGETIICKRMLRRVRQTARCHRILPPGFVGGGSQPCITHNDVAKGWTSTVHRQDKHGFSLIMIELKLVSTHQDGNQLGSLSYLPRVRIEKRGSEKPINLTEQLFIERSLTIYYNSKKRTVPSCCN